MTVWTVFVVFAVYWLLHSSGTPGGAPKGILHGTATELGFGERTKLWLQLAHYNFQRLYPWVLFAPYVAWLSSCFILERGRLHLSIPIHVAAAVLFVMASTSLSSRVSMAMGRVMVITRHESNGELPEHAREIQTIQVAITGPAVGPMVQDEDIRVSERSGTSITSILTHSAEDLNRYLPTNLIPKLERVMKPLPAPGRTPINPMATLLDLLAYGSVAGVSHAVHFYRRFRERERRATVLEASLTKARLSALQAQLQPHFLFNTLNAIATLLRRDPKAAESTLTTLSELLRLALSQADKQEIPLRDEMRFLERYMEIQQTRFGDRLQFKSEVQPQVLDCLVPTLTLQPLVENAIRHGIEPSLKPGRIRVAASETNGNLLLKVEDNGVGIRGQGLREGNSNSGIGLGTLQTRLEAIYGSNHSIHISSPAEGGFLVSIEIPTRSSDSLASDRI